MKQTYGIFLIDGNNNLLLIHATNAPWNSFGIPKGGFENHVDKTSFDAAKRELLEETNINLDEYTIEYKKTLNSIKYRTGKKILHSYIIKIKEPLDIKDLSCPSFVKDKNGLHLHPENDGFALISLKNMFIKGNLHGQGIHESQRNLLDRYKKEFDKYIN